ncbi:hypothetical protein STPH1_7220 [Streptomyces sp. OM5714]|nr:hypothetical protein STPH1_7220 [Streptomyces sp. OM5714]
MQACVDCQPIQFPRERFRNVSDKPSLLATRHVRNGHEIGFMAGTEDSRRRCAHPSAEVGSVLPERQYAQRVVNLWHRTVLQQWLLARQITSRGGVAAVQHDFMPRRQLNHLGRQRHILSAVPSPQENCPPALEHEVQDSRQRVTAPDECRVADWHHRLLPDCHIAAD